MNLLRLMIFAAVALLHSFPVIATETDQFSNRGQAITDSTVALNSKVNEALATVAAEQYGDRNRKAIVRAVYRRLGGAFIVDKIERWAIDSPSVEKQDTSKRNNIYTDMPFGTTRLIYLFGFGRTIRVNDQLIGLDKISHFMSQGKKFYGRYLKHGSETAAAERSAFLERGIFGSLTTGSFSNADLVANYEGYLFYRSLFEDDIIPGKLAILRWQDDGWLVQRNFDWADHVNEYWDEALNVNKFNRRLEKHMRLKLLTLCEEFRRNPALYDFRDEELLRARYTNLGLQHSTHLRLDHLCTTSSLSRESSN